MTFGHYAFAFFVFMLFCAAIYLAAKLFGDVKRRALLLDEKETKLLLLYQTIEETMDQHNDSIEQARSDTLELRKELDELMRDAAAELYSARKKRKSTAENAEQAPAKKTGSAAKASSKKQTKGSDFEQALAKAGASPTKEQSDSSASQPAPATNRNGGYREKVMQLSGGGMPAADIAKQLQITKTEVDLIIGLRTEY